VALDPELVGADVLDADDLAEPGVDVRDPVEVLHVPALRVGLADLLLRVQDAVEVDAGDVEQELWRHKRPGAAGNKTNG
jgi:hypothetical protein